MSSFVTLMTNPDKSLGKKTLVVEVFTTDGNTFLGEIKWFSRWRCYSFFPNPQTVYEKRCMRDIADTCDMMTENHRIQKAIDKAKG